MNTTNVVLETVDDLQPEDEGADMASFLTVSLTPEQFDDVHAIVQAHGDDLNPEENEDPDMPWMRPELYRAISGLHSYVGREDEELPDGWQYLPQTDSSRPRRMAKLRSEEDLQDYSVGQAGYRSDVDGNWCFFSVHSRLRSILKIVYDDELVGIRDRYDKSYVEAVIPSSHASHSLYTLRPKPRNLKDVGPHVPEVKQAASIAELGQLPMKRGLTLLGPGGCGKTTDAAVWIKDEMTERLVFGENVPFFDKVTGRDRVELCVWRIKLGTWLKQTHAWSIRGKEDLPLRPLDAEFVALACSRAPQHKPILWIEECDKFVATETKLNEIHTLVDEIHERGGMIIVTSNWTKKEFAAALPYSIRRRITGDNEPDREENYLIWDMHRDVERG